MFWKSEKMWCEVAQIKCSRLHQTSACIIFILLYCMYMCIMSSSMALKRSNQIKICIRKLTKVSSLVQTWTSDFFFFTLPSLYHYGNSNNHNLFPYFVDFFVILRVCTNQMKEWWKLAGGERENKSGSAQHNLFLPVNSTQGRNPGFGLWVGKRDQCILVWVWRVRGLSYSKEVFWALERVQAAERGEKIHINAVDFHHPCLFRWFFTRWRGGSNGHINNKLSINVTGVELLLWIAG